MWLLKRADLSEVRILNGHPRNTAPAGGLSSDLLEPVAEGEGTQAWKGDGTRGTEMRRLQPLDARRKSENDNEYLRMLGVATSCDAEAKQAENQRRADAAESPSAQPLRRY